MVNLTDYNDFFLFLGGFLVIGGVVYFLFRRSLQNVFITEQEAEGLIAEEKISKSRASDQISAAKISLPKISISVILLAIIIGAFLFNQFLMLQITKGGKISIGSFSIDITRKVSNMKLSLFDVALAKERMDKNNDGICDECGMKIEQCIETGQIDCTMGKNKNGMGVLGSQHIHADLKVYINGQALDFAKPEYFMKSSVLHVDSNQNKEDSSGVLHMHATKVPLWLFFKSLGFSLQKDSLTLADGRVLKNENGNSLKFYLNGQKVDELADYVFQPQDKLLVSFGPENDSNIQKQISSITNFAKDH